jgi:hypothetical protein
MAGIPNILDPFGTKTRVSQTQVQPDVTTLTQLMEAKRENSSVGKSGRTTYRTVTKWPQCLDNGLLFGAHPETRYGSTNKSAFSLVYYLRYHMLGVALEAAGFVGANFLPLVDCETSVTTIGSRTPNGPGSRK